MCKCQNSYCATVDKATTLIVLQINIAEYEAQWMLHFQTIIDITGCMAPSTLITEVFFKQFLICVAV